MLRPHELDVDLTVLVAARPAIVDQKLNVDPFLHWNLAAYDGAGPNPSLLPEAPPIPVDHNYTR